MKQKFVFLGYCGICGRDVDTDYCYHCQREVQLKEGNMKNKKNKQTTYSGGIDKCPKCGNTILSTGADTNKMKTKILRWYHRCVKCGNKIYFEERKQ